MVEFAEPDLPWRFTPAGAGDLSRLRPWLVLCVLADGEITDEAPAGADGRLPAVTVASAAALPRLDQSWAWAHVQVDAFDPSSESLAAVSVQPGRSRSRLLAPRHLLPRTSYTALLVPAFERGRLAGLRETVPDTVDGLAPPGPRRDRDPAAGLLPVVVRDRGRVRLRVAGPAPGRPGGARRHRPVRPRRLGRRPGPATGRVHALAGRRRADRPGRRPRPVAARLPGRVRSRAGRDAEPARRGPGQGRGTTAGRPAAVGPLARGGRPARPRGRRAAAVVATSSTPTRGCGSWPAWAPRWCAVTTSS